jgi:UPF0271 protein
MSRDRIDLNADVGEGLRHDHALMRVVSSANVACGGHAGDPDTMRATVVLARDHGVAVGAHPSFPDRAGFGRREMTLSPREVAECVADQLRALASIASAEGVRLRHVKPHGALYNLAAGDRALADIIARTVGAFDGALVLFGLAGSALIDAGARAGLATASEAFADRAYRSDGSLVPRTDSGAVLHDAGIVVPRAIGMARDGAIAADDGTRLTLSVDTICVHGDTPAAATLAARIRAALEEAGIAVASIGSR